MFFKSIVLHFFLLLNSCFAEITDSIMAERFRVFKSSLVPARDCANSILFLEKLSHNFRNELVEVNKSDQIEMMEKILYSGAGVGGFSGKICTPREYTIMTEVAIILEIWHKKRGVPRYFATKILSDNGNALTKKHYQTLKYISIATDEVFNGDGEKHFFKDKIHAIAAAIKASETDMTEDKLLRIPAMRQFDALVANLMTSPGFSVCSGNQAADYAAIPVDDGLNALRTDMHALMSVTTTADAIRLTDAIETKCWALPLTALEDTSHLKRTLIRRAFAAVERIKSVRFDGGYQTKDPRPAEDKFKDIPQTADVSIKKKQTLLLLMSMALQEYFYNPLNSLDDIKKIILAKLQQSNYWEGATPLLAEKTDLQPYPSALPAYADIALDITGSANTIPLVYKSFVSGIEQRAMQFKSGIHYVGGNTFLHLESSGAACQCGFFSFGLMDDGAASNARQKYFEMLSNSLEFNTLRSVAKMSSVLESIELWATFSDLDFSLLRIFEKGKEKNQRAFYPEAKGLVDGLKTLGQNVIRQQISGIELAYEINRTAELQRIGLRDGYLFGDADLRKIPFEKLAQQKFNDKENICTESLRKLLLRNEAARKAFASYTRTVLVAKLLEEETQVVGTVNYSDTNQQLLFRPGSERYQSVNDLSIRAAAISPTQTIAEALNANVQVLSAAGQFVGTYGQVIDYLEPSRAFAPNLYVLQDILVNERAKNQLLINFGGGHYEKLISLSDPVALVRALRHLAWMRRAVPELR